MERGGRDAGLVLELLGGDAGRGGAEHRDAGVREGLGDGAGGGRLAGAGEADDADDAVGLVATARTIASCSAESDESVGALDLVERLGAIAGACASRPRSTSASAARSAAMSSAVE